MGNDNQGDTAKTTWTPEQKIQGFKELVTAILGFLIMFCTLILAALTFSYVNEPTKITNAKDILQILLGLAGVVIGYYFGRVPADARAAQAQEQANTATAQTEQVNAQVQVMANNVEHVMDKISPAASVAARGASTLQNDPDFAKDLQRIRDDLRALASMSRLRR
jgi:cytochrome c biogenesis protein CcdA